MTHEDYIKQAKDLGAVSMRIFHTEKPIWPNDKVRLPFSYHFFDIHDNEIGYYIKDLIGFPMMTFAIHRKWSEEFKNNSAYELVDLKLV